MSVWRVHSERTVYGNRWLTVNLADVELPDGRRLDHYVLRQRPVAAAAIVDESDRVLMLWRHRFIPDSWGWELPAGVVDVGETPVETAARETEEETGWRPRDLRPLLRMHPAGGLSDCVHYVFWTRHAEHVGAAVDAHESERVAWVPLAEVPTLLERGELRESNAVAATLRLHLMMLAGR
ncbi:NUDIX domain-containing protein [Thermasporomyces composti]|jgi:8-oxo-dGTP pyrophosphatase MutT (NUDIX family)|uniref:ADP-ribose pyrophosphatase YjhB (NUDIX family) n=1 Tax=Thermasporomyces composti TaxID=696763 RepID=A0A3D9V3D5_THECX|nr:NUDIX domain-containing protein [Thermasporomyces composti]REF36322.1 ADP-ribose pyrophosphatase YjhB (NUDIX family) [Thermasporomyces composti]